MNNGELKKLVGTAAVDRFVTDGLMLGLGTGSTAVWAVRRLAEMYSRGSLPGIRVVTTSFQSEIEARSLGLPVLTLTDAVMRGGLDLTIDGADEIDAERNLIKGGGGALLMEKVVAYASRRFIVIADESKLSSRLCEKFPIPVEILPGALGPVSRALESMGARVSLREATKKAGPVVTDHGNLLLDAFFTKRFDPAALEAELKLIPGVLEDGIFTKRKPELLIVRADGTIDYRK
jgi:ribose 5-phosphate isomerase A